MKTISKQKRKINLLITVIAVFAISIFLNSCKQGNNKKENGDKTTEAPQAVEAVEVDAWYIEEQDVVDLPQVTIDADEEKPAAPAKNTGKENTVHKKAIAVNDSEITFDEFDAALRERDYIPVVASVKQAVIPLDEKQTLTAYTKKGKEKAAMQVVSSPDGTVDQVVFYNKKHKDVYNVQVGMTGKEVKKLRKDMKHMVKDGKVFLYNDDSNILYMMKAEDNLGDEIDTAQIDNMQVQAIVWKPTKREMKKAEKG